MSDLTDNRPTSLWQRGSFIEPTKKNPNGRQLWYSSKRKKATLPRINPADMYNQLSPEEQAQVLALLKI